MSISPRLYVSAILLNITIAPAHAQDEISVDEGIIAQYANVISDNDHFSIYPDSRSNSHDLEFVIYRDGSDVSYRFRRCHSDTFRLCLDFGTLFRIALPCDQELVGRSWQFNGWRFQLISTLQRTDGPPDLIINAIDSKDQSVRIVYSYQDGIRLFAFVGTMPLPDDGTVEIPYTAGLYILQHGRVGVSESFCD